MTKSENFDSTFLLFLNNLDDNYLTIFLRTKKYNLNEVFKSYEKNYLFRLKCSKWFDLSDDKVVARLRSHIQSGSKYVIKDYSSTEPIIYIQRFEKFDVQKYPITDIFYSDYIIWCLSGTRKSTNLWIPIDYRFFKRSFVSLLISDNK